MANKIYLTGNLTRDPELRFTQAGRPVCSLGVADEHRFMQNNEWQSKTTFHNLTVWGDQAENASASLKKGDTVVVEGRLESRQYETDGGEKRTAFEIIVDTIGASMRWATIGDITRTNTHAAGAPSGQRGQADPNPSYPDEPF